MSSQSPLKLIKTQELRVPNEPTNEKLRSPAATVVKWQNSYLKTFAIFQYCYLERQSLNNGRLPHEKTRDFLVNPDSLCSQRLELVTNWLQRIVAEECKPRSAQHIGQALTWVDQEGLNSLLYTEKTLRCLYVQYTAHLIQLVQKKQEFPNSPEGLKPISAGNLQRALQMIIEYSIGIKRTDSKNWATVICSSYFDPWFEQFKKVEPIVLLVGENLYQDEDIVPQKTEVRFTSKTTETIRAFNFCYLDRASLVKKGSGKSHKAQLCVNPASLSPSRCRIISHWIRDMLNGLVTLSHSRSVKIAFDWIDRANKDPDIYNLERAQSLYLDFSAHLDRCVSNKTFGKNSAVNHQVGMSYILSISLSIDAPKIESWAPKITLQHDYEYPTGLYVDLETYELIANSTDKPPKNIHPEQVVLRLSEKSTANIAKLCYLDRASLIPAIHKSSVFGRKVNLASWCPKRCRLMTQVVKQAVTGVLQGQQVMQIGVVLEWIDGNRRSEELRSIASAKMLYLDYTQYLFHESRLSKIGDKKGKSDGWAASLQQAMALVISLSINVSNSIIRNWAVQIIRNNRNLPQPRLNENAAKAAYQIHSRFFWAYSQVALGQSPNAIPLVVRLADLGCDNYIGFSFRNSNYTGYEARGKKRTWRDAAFSEKGFDTDIESVKRKTGDLGIHWTSQSTNKYNFTKTSLASTGFAFSFETIRHFANRAIKHFGHMLMYASGANADHLASIDCQDSMLTNKIGTDRLIAYKQRSLNEMQTLTVPSAFRKEWRQMIRLRDQIATWCGRDAPRFGLFTGRVNNAGKKAGKNEFTKLSASDITSSLAWPDNGPSQTTRTPRKIKIQKLLEISGGNISLVSGMVSNKPRTIKRHYGFKTFEDSAKQMAEFFNALKASANLRVSGNPSAPIVISGERIPVGNCTATSEDDRAYIDGIEESRAPELSCGAPLACFFCKSFGILNDYEDIHRILSVAVYIKFQSNHKSIAIEIHAKKFLSVIHRIEEIIDSFERRGETEKEIVCRAKKAIARGNLDSFWQSQINSLLDAMEVI